MLAGLTMVVLGMLLVGALYALPWLYVRALAAPRMKSVARCAKRWGLHPFGYAQEDYRHHHQLLYIWSPFRRPRWEVRRWHVGMGASDIADWIKPLPFGSLDAYHRIELSAERVHVGRDFHAAKDAMCREVPS